MSFIENYDEIKSESESQGINEGIERAKKDSYEQGFKDGVVRGIEKGILLAFIDTAKKILKMINKIHTDKYEELEQKVKVIKTNLILINKNNIIKEKKNDI